MIATTLAACRWAAATRRASPIHRHARDYLMSRRGLRGVRGGHNARRSFAGQLDPLALELEALP